ncbi:MAG: hypothetical protein ACFFD4_34715 [Candidatus Odinarchaeota archaeon]
MMNPVVESAVSDFSDNVLHAKRSTCHTHLSTLTIFYQSKLGPAIMGDKHLPFVTKNCESDLQKLGSFFSVAIGQGSYYNTGCFGPLPALGSDYNCLIYSIIVKDDASFDSRMQGWNYILACFFYHKSLDQIINEKKISIEAFFCNYFQKNDNIGCFTPEKIKDLKSELMSLLTA